MQLVWLKERVNGVDNVGRPADDECDENDKQRDHDAPLLHEDHVLRGGAVHRHAARVCADRAEDAAVAERHDGEGHEVTRRRDKRVVDVVARVVRVRRPALRRVRLVTHAVEPVDGEVPDEHRPEPHGGYEQQYPAVGEDVAERTLDGHVLVHADVHEGVDRRDEEQRHREAVELTQGVPGGPSAVQNGQQ